MHDSSSIRKLIQIFLSLKKNQQKKFILQVILLLKWNITLMFLKDSF